MNWKRVFKVLFWMQAGVNLVGAMGPELSFDALWYHLPIARLMAERGRWGVIPGGLLYTSATPRIIEFVNAFLLTIGNWVGLASPELLPKLLSYGVGLGCAGIVYRIASLYVKPVYAWAGVVLWYSNLVVGWQSIVTYVDLHRTFFTLAAIWYLINWWLTKKLRLAFISGIFWGLAYSTKVIGGIDLVFVSAALILWERRRVGGIILMAGVAALLASVWGVGNILQGYSFFYPFYGQKIYMPPGFSLANSHLLSPIRQFFDWRLRTGPFVLVPLALAGKSLWRKMPKELLVIGAALFAAWWFTPASATKGDGRYFLPSLAIMAVLASYSLANLRGIRRKMVIAIVVMSGLVGIGYRAAANAKFVPYLLGKESKKEFLTRKLNFDYGDWYDIDNWVSENLADKPYLVVGVHNTYYLPGKEWEHESWIESQKCYPYVLIQGDYPAKTEWELAHEVAATKTKIYETDCF